MFQVAVNNHSYEVLADEGALHVNGELLNWDITPLSENHFHILYKGKSYRAEVVKMDSVLKTVIIKINGQTVTVTLKSKFDLLLEKMGINNAVSGKLNNIKAPMPGLIIELKINVGDEVKKGDPVLILEAMKMENILKSPGDGIVKAVKVKKGDSVEKNHVLIEF